MIKRIDHHWQNLGAWIQAHPWLAYGLALAFCLLSAISSVGWIQPDEHARVLEAAHQLVFGFASLPWELQAPQPIVSFLLGAVHAPVLWLAHVLGADGLQQASVLRAFSACFASLRFILFWQLLSALGLRSDRRGIYSLLYAFGPLTLILIPRTSQENWGTTALMGSLLLILKALSSCTRRRYFAGAGFLAALAVSFRLQLGTSCFGLGLWILWSMRGRARATSELLSFAGGVALGLLPMAVVDVWTFGKPLLPAWNYFHYAISDEDGAAAWGRSSWTDYLYGFLTIWYPPVSLLLLPLMAWGSYVAGCLGSIILPNLLVHAALSHKELRYLSPLIPFWTLAAFKAWEFLESRWTSDIKLKILRWLSPYASFMAILNIIAALIVVNPQPYFYSQVNALYERGVLPKGFHFVANSRSGLSEFYFKHPDAQPQNKLLIPHFLSGLDAGSLPQGYYALQRIRFHEMSRVKKNCTLIYNSIPLWQQKVYQTLGELLKFRYFDAIAYCSSKPSSE